MKEFQVFAAVSAGGILGNVQLRMIGQLITLTELVTTHTTRN
jgi:hypothetical protein